MATVTTRSSLPTELDPRVLHPLDHLRGVIRRYVILEGLLLAGLFLIGWFTLALLLDFGVFRTTSWDWVLDAPRWFRGFALVIGLAGLAVLVAVRMIIRLTKEFSYSSLALVLERRFPKILGDRLITAVELADIDRQSRYGYSPEMIRQTIAEARQRVGTVPVHDVFNWRRLWRLAGAGVGSIALLLGLAYLAFGFSSGSYSLNRFAWRCVHVSSTILERDVRIQDVPWPRQAHLVLVGFPDEGIRVGKDTPPTIRARAVEYVFSDPAEVRGWRPMRWSDLKHPTMQIEAPTRAFEQFETIDGVANTESTDWSIDEVGLIVNRLNERVADVRKTLEAINAAADKLESEQRLIREDDKSANPDYTKWYVPDPTTTQKRRQVRWDDLRKEERKPDDSKDAKPTARKDTGSETRLVGLLDVTALPEVPSARLKAIEGQPGVRALSGPQTRWTLAEVATFVGAVAQETAPLEPVLTRVAEVADRPSMGRQIRKLDIPRRVMLFYSGVSKSGDITLDPKPNNEFVGLLSDLRESVEFYVQAENFRTDPRSITFIPPPALVKLSRIEYQPAYLHHPAPPEGVATLRGLRQKLPEQVMSLNGDRSVISVPAGTDLILTGQTDKALKQAVVIPKSGLVPGGKFGTPQPILLPLAADRKGFEFPLKGDLRVRGTLFGALAEFRDPVFRIQATKEFTIEFMDDDGVKSRRHILIQVTEDQKPAVELTVDFLRKEGGVYIVTANARIPFQADSMIRDDHGLSKVVFEYEYWTEDSEIIRAMRAQLASRVFLSPPGPGPATLPAVVVPWHHLRKFGDLDKGTFRLRGESPLPRFVDQQRRIRTEPLGFIENALGGDLPWAGRQLREQGVKFDEHPPAAVTKVELKSPEGDAFDLRDLSLVPDYGWGSRRVRENGLQIDSVGEGQPRYRVRLYLVATDNNPDAPADAPRTSMNTDRLEFLVVSEGDLLAKINQEQRTLGESLDEAVTRLAAARKKIEFMKNKNDTGTRPGAGGNPPTLDPGDLDAARVRGQDGAQDIARAREIVDGVMQRYRKIYRECQFNRIPRATTDGFLHFGNRLDRVLGANPDRDEIEQNEFLKEEELRRDKKLLPFTTFPMTEKLVNGVLGQLATTWAAPNQVQEAYSTVLYLESEVTRLRDMLGKNLTLAQLEERLQSIIDTRERLHNDLLEWRKTEEARRLSPEPELLPVGQIVLAKGEVRKVRQAINWRQFDKSDLKVKLSVDPAGGLTIPEQLVLNDERDVTTFEYEIRAGTKEGDYTLTLTPEAGRVVRIRVKVN